MFFNDDETAEGSEANMPKEDMPKEDMAEDSEKMHDMPADTEEAKM